MTVSEYLGVYCATCKQDCLPLPNGRCGFCDTLVVNPNADPAATPVAPVPSPQEAAVQVDTCKIEGCTRASAGKGGPWARMCQDHISEEIARRHAKRLGNREPKAAAKPAPPVAHSPTSNGEAPPGSLTKLAATVENRQRELQLAREAHVAAVQALREALDTQAA